MERYKRWRYVTVDKHGAKFSISDKESLVTFTKAKVLQSVKFLLSNCFFKLWNEVFQEIIGIPTGKDTANIFYELISLILWNLVYSKTKNLEGLCALEMFLGSLMTWVHLMIELKFETRVIYSLEYWYIIKSYWTKATKRW